MQPTLKTDITLTPHSPWVWHVSRAGKRLGTVSGDSVAGFTARDINSHSIGRGYVSAEAAKQSLDRSSRCCWTIISDVPVRCFNRVLMPGVPPRPATVAKMVTVALTRAERQKAADLIKRLLDLVDDCCGPDREEWSTACT